MKKLGVAISLIMLIISVITISYASFIVNGEDKLLTSVSNISVKTSSASIGKYNLVTFTSSKGLPYDRNDYTIVKEDAKIEVKFNITDYYTRFTQQYICFTLDVKSNTILYNLNPNIYMYINDKFSYFDVSFNGTSYIAAMPISRNTIYDNNYFAYIASSNITGITLIIDFSNVIANGAKLNSINEQLELICEAKEVV